jgi:YgiT-type zinc finger domain-containing protein
MKCVYCKGEMELKSSPFHVDRKGYHLVLDTVPAWICTQCGEAYFEESEVDVIQDILTRLDEGTQKLSVAV